MKITIECNEEQADLIAAALEDYFRLRMGQADHMAMSLAGDTFKWDESNPENKKLFDEYIERRANLFYVYQALIKIAHVDRIRRTDAFNTSDIWRCLSHELYMTSDGEKSDWDVRGDKPIKLGTLDLPKIEVER